MRPKVSGHKFIMQYEATALDSTINILGRNDVRLTAIKTLSRERSSCSPYEGIPQT